MREYVLLNDSPEKTVKGSRQLNLPLSKDLYKIKEIHKNGFSLTLLNVRTLDLLTVVHSRITHVSLNSLLSYDFGFPSLWNKLTDLNIKNRKTYRVDPTKRPLALFNPEEFRKERLIIIIILICIGLCYKYENYRSCLLGCCMKLIPNKLVEQSNFKKLNSPSVTL